MNDIVDSTFPFISENLHHVLAELNLPPVQSSNHEKFREAFENVVYNHLPAGRAFRLCCVHRHGVAAAVLIPKLTKDDLASGGQWGCSLLEYALFSEDPVVMHKLLQHPDVDVNAVNRAGLTPWLTVLGHATTKEESLHPFLYLLADPRVDVLRHRQRPEEEGGETLVGVWHLSTPLDFLTNNANQCKAFLLAWLASARAFPEDPDTWFGETVRAIKRAEEDKAAGRGKDEITHDNTPMGIMTRKVSTAALFGATMNQMGLGDLMGQLFGVRKTASSLEDACAILKDCLTPAGLRDWRMKARMIVPPHMVEKSGLNRDSREAVRHGHALNIYTLMVMVTDGYAGVRDVPSPGHEAATRFFAMASRLPLELQMVLAHRAVGSATDKFVVRGDEFESGLRIVAEQLAAQEKAIADVIRYMDAPESDDDDDDEDYDEEDDDLSDLDKERMHSLFGW